MKKFLFTLFAAYLCLSSFAQTHEVEWQNTIGSGNNDFLHSIGQTTDSGYILGGTSYASKTVSGDKTEAGIGNDDFWIIKLTKSGQTIQWQNTIGGAKNDELEVVKQTADGGYILAGSSKSNISGDKTENNHSDKNDYWIVKLNSKGKVKWDKTYGGLGTDELYSIEQTIDGGYILAGSSDSNIGGDKTENCRGREDYWIVKIDINGNLQWQKTLGGSEFDIASSIHQTTDGGYIVGGTSYSGKSGDKSEVSKGATDYWVLKLNNNGNILWQHSIGGNSGDYFRCVQQTKDGGYILGGESFSPISGDKTEGSMNGDYWIIKLNNVGNILWQNTIGGSGDDNLISLQQTKATDFILGGYSISNISGDKNENSINNTYDYWVIKINEVGDIIWQNTVGGSNVDYLYSVMQTNDKGYIIGGASNSNISGDKNENSNGGWDYWFVKLSPNLNTISSSANVAGLTSRKNSPDVISKILVYPNPAKDQLYIQSFKETLFSLKTNTGSVLLTQKINGRGSINVSKLTAGVYYLTDNSGLVYKIVKE